LSVYIENEKSMDIIQTLLCVEFNIAKNNNSASVIIDNTCNKKTLPTCWV
jgi:hypothetical protein